MLLLRMNASAARIIHYAKLTLVHTQAKEMKSEGREKNASLKKCAILIKCSKSLKNLSSLDDDPSTNAMTLSPNTFDSRSSSTCYVPQESISNLTKKNIVVEGSDSKISCTSIVAGKECKNPIFLTGWRVPQFFWGTNVPGSLNN